MSDDENASDDETEDADGDESEVAQDEDEIPRAPSFRDKIRARAKLIVISTVALVVIGGGLGLYFSGALTPPDPSRVVMSLPGAPVLQALPLMSVDLKPSPNRRRPFIRVVLEVELQGPGAQAAFVARETKVLDAIQTHLRTLTVEDLAGKAGTERLRRDLITIVQRIIRPERVITVLYKEILIR